MDFLRKYKLSTQLLLMVLPLVLGAVMFTGLIIGTISSNLASQGITKTSRDDLTHLAEFSIDLLGSHYRQYEVYKEDKKNTVREELRSLVNFAAKLVDEQESSIRRGQTGRNAARALVGKALKEISVGPGGYLYAMNTKGDLLVHIAQEGTNILDARDESGRYFIREMCQKAAASKEGEVLYIEYPWKNAILGEKEARRKIVAYRYYPKWDWILAAGSYFDETVEQSSFEKRAFEELKSTIKKKKVGTTGYIYAIDEKGTAVVHPFREGQSLYDERDHKGGYFIREMVEKKSGWIEYPWQNEGDAEPRMKIVRYEYFAPWKWVVAVGSYRNEFMQDAELISGRVLVVMFLAVGFGMILSIVLVYRMSLSFTMPITRMTQILRKVKGSRMGGNMDESGSDELSELAKAYNRMTESLERHLEMESSLAQQGKMASLGVLSSGVAHEINNPLGIILGYAAYLENKLPPDDPNLKYVQEIKRESKRSKKIVQDLLSYARAPRLAFEEVDVAALVSEITDFAKNHADLAGIIMVRDFEPCLRRIRADADHLKQVCINLILNAGAAMSGHGTLTISAHNEGEDKVRIVFDDTGPGIDPETAARIFEPFFTTRQGGTGLGLSITKQIIERHRGSIEVVSEPGKGTRVIVTLRVNPEGY